MIPKVSATMCISIITLLTLIELIKFVHLKRSNRRTKKEKMAHFFATSEIDSDQLYLEGYSFDDLGKNIDTNNSNRIILVLNCCYSVVASLAGKGYN
jgi:hypothetical protein